MVTTGERRSPVSAVHDLDDALGGRPASQALAGRVGDDQRAVLQQGARLPAFGQPPAGDLGPYRTVALARGAPERPGRHGGAGPGEARGRGAPWLSGADTEPARLPRGPA